MMHQLNRILPKGGGLRYDRAVSAELRSLDIYTMFDQTDALLAKVDRNIVSELPKAGEGELAKNCLVDAQVLPADVRKSRYYLAFHVDRDAYTDGKRALLGCHLKYRLRPVGPMPHDLKLLRHRDRTAEWAERSVTGLGRSYLAVEAELLLKKWKRRRPAFAVPTIQAGGTSLLHCGSEYRADIRRPDQVNRFRWVEQSPGTLSVWLSYSVTLSEAVDGLWSKQEKQCREFLEQLV